MGQFFGRICCCFRGVTPSTIPDSQLTQEFKVPDPKFRNFADVFQMKGYDYNNRKELASGGFATVYRITKIKDKGVFALKEIHLKGTDTKRDPKKFKNLKNEVFVASTIRHKNIVPLFDHFIINNTCYLVMQFANSGTVQEDVHTFGPMTENKAKSYFIQIARAIEHLHLRSPPIAHRDLKLANIMIHIQNEEKILKVTDFGLSKVLTENSSRVIRPEGTPLYMSLQMLELVLHRNKIDPKVREGMRLFGIIPKTVNPIKADIWSLGVCLNFMVSEEFPYIINNWEDNDEILYVVKQMKSAKRTPIRLEGRFPKKNIEKLNHLIDQMLSPKTSERIEISDIIRHQWLSGVSEVIKIKEKKKTVN